MAVQLSEEGKMDETIFETAMSLWELEMLRCEDTSLKRAVTLLASAVCALATSPASEAPPPTTATPTPTAPTPGVPSDAVAMERTTHTDWTLSPLATKTAGDGPVGQGSECAHIWLFPHLEIRDNWAYRAAPAQCMKCRASRSFDVTPAPAAGVDTSTSQRQLSKPWGSGLSGESEPLPSSASTDTTTRGRWKFDDENHICRENPDGSVFYPSPWYLAEIEAAHIKTLKGG